MKDVQKILLLVVTAVVLITAQIAVFIYGWGMEPLNWWWIIGVQGAASIFGAVVSVVTKD